MDKSQIYYWGEKTFNELHMKFKTIFVWLVLPLMVFNLLFGLLIAQLFFSKKLSKFIDLTFGNEHGFSAWSSFPSFLWSPYLHESKQLFYDYIGWSFTFFFQVSLFGIIPSFFIGRYIYKKMKEKSASMVEEKFIRGSRLFTNEEYIAKARQQKIGIFNIQGIPVPKEAETSHFIITGASGRGKTQILKHPNC